MFQVWRTTWRSALNFKAIVCIGYNASGRFGERWKTVSWNEAFLNRVLKGDKSINKGSKYWFCPYSLLANKEVINELRDELGKY